MVVYLLAPSTSFSATITLDVVKGKGIVVSTDPHWDYNELPFHKIAQVFENTSILFGNEFEILKMSKKRDSHAAIDTLLRTGLQFVVMTMGRRGAIISSNNRRVKVPSVGVRKPINHVGAGDAFAGDSSLGILKLTTLRGPPWLECERPLMHY